MRDILLIAVVSGFSLVALFRPFVGIVFFVWLGFFNPQSYTWSVAQTLPLSYITAVSTVIGFFISGEAKRILLRRESILLLMLWAVFGFSSLTAIYPDQAADRLISISKILLMVFLTILLTTNKSRLDALLRAIALSLGFYGLKGGVFAIATGGQSLVFGPENSFLEANNAIGLALAMNIPLLYYLLRIETRTWLRWVIKAMMWASFPAVICTYSRGAWLGLAIISVLLLLKNRHKFLVVALAGVFLALSYSTLPQLLPERLFSRYDQLVNYEKDDSAESRLWNWEFCKRVGLARPLTGGGFNYYSMETHARYYPEFLERWPEKEWTCHSAWLTVFGEHGFPGFILWISLLVCCLLTLRQIRAYGKTRPEILWIPVFADAIQISFVAYMVVGTFLDAAYFDMFYYLVAMVIVGKEIALAVLQLAPASSLTPASAITAPVLGGVRLT
jgi:probable O-glycosylation ligase (exosortase A-associated)